MKQLRWFNLGMVLILLVASLATFTSANASVPDPGGLYVKKFVETSVAAKWSWDIDKTASVGSLVLSPGQTYDVGYEVTLTATPLASAYHIWGTVVIRNLSAGPAVISSITDTLSDGTSVKLECGTDGEMTFPHTLPAGWTMNCTYDVTLDHPVTSNTVTAVSDIGTFSETAMVTFGDPSDVVDECVDVFDDKYGDLGTVCAGDSPKTFAYTMTVGPFETCGLYVVKNTASFLTNDTGKGGFDVVEIPVDVPCDEGCTLTPGYWKTHSMYGPAPYDDTWAQIGEDSAFFYSGKSYYDVLWTSSAGGNAYYILARAYIAAELNQLNGASVPAEVATAFAAATALFDNPTNTPAYVGGLKGSARATWINLAYVLDRYNNGLYGPMHCSE